MKEKDIKKKAIEQITKQGGVAWCPPKVKWLKENDIFGVFDAIVIYPPSNVVFVQWTSKGNIRARENKVLGFMKAKKVSIYAEVWGWDSVNNKFKIINIYGGKEDKDKKM